MRRLIEVLLPPLIPEKNGLRKTAEQHLWVKKMQQVRQDLLQNWIDGCYFIIMYIEFNIVNNPFFFLYQFLIDLLGSLC